MFKTRKLPKHVVSRVTHKTCPHCGVPAWYSGFQQDEDAWGWDAYFCKVCDVWQERCCSQNACELCCGRPARPSGVTLPETQW